MNAVVLITRPEPDASDFAQMLRRQNCRSLKYPLTEIVFVPDTASKIKANLIGVQMVLATSANALRASLPPEIFSLPIFVVGATTGQEARRAGFAQVMTAQEDMASLAREVIAARSAADGALLYLTGRHRAGDLVGCLAQHGFEVRVCELYEARAVACLAPEIIDAFRSGMIDVVSFFSLRAAEIFCDLVVRHDLAAYLDRVWAACLARAAAERLADLGFGNIRIAAQRRAEAMCELIASC